VSVDWTDQAGEPGTGRGFVPSDILMRDMEIYIIIYIGFSLFALKADDTYEPSRKMNPILWDVLIVLLTLATIGIYAL
jgi:hypothetical protein